MKYLLSAVLTFTPLWGTDLEPAKRLGDVAALFSEIMAAPDMGIPRELLQHAYCIAIVTGEKGFLFCRNNAGPGWSAPAAVRVEGRNLEPKTDLVVLVMDEMRADQVLSSKLTLGAEASVVAGPLGQTTAKIHADALSWSRSQGVFAGKSLDGVTLRQDLDANAALYGGNRLENREIVTEGVLPPHSATRILDLLNRYSFMD